MKTRFTLLAATVATLSLPSAATLHAQQASLAGPAYYVADFEVTDREAIRPYSANVEATFAPFGGRFIVRGGDPVPLEGQSPKGRLVVIEFDSMEKAQAWYNSPAYSQLRPIRQSAGRSNVYIVQDLPK